LATLRSVIIVGILPETGVSSMKKIACSLREFHADEKGAAFIEYTALLGVILAVGLAVLVAVGGWASGRWKTLCTTLGASGC